MTRDQFDRYRRAARSLPSFGGHWEDQRGSGLRHDTTYETDFGLLHRLRPGPGQSHLRDVCLYWYGGEASWRCSDGPPNKETGLDAVLAWEAAAGVSVDDLEVLLIFDDP
jgi:hypothetical protein